MSKKMKKLIALSTVGVTFALLGGSGCTGWITGASIVGFFLTGTLNNLGVLAGAGL